jgi:hypothetical protein
MEHYVTSFDSLYLPQGLALHASMERCAGSYILWILCVDDCSYELLQKLDLAHVRLLQLSKLETVELKRVKVDRTTGEYCWTLTPFTIRFVFEADKNIHRVTYLDADMWFRRNPSQIFKEFDEAAKQVLITDHGFLPESDDSSASGQYCVQFMTFTRDGEQVRKWWEDRCIEWCFARYEEGRFGDQMYLNDWPERFAEDVYILQDQQLLLAPWNAARFPYGRSICYHFHGLRISNKILLNDGYAIPDTVINHIYKKYVEDLKIAIGALKAIGYIHRNQIPSRKMRQILMSIFRGLYQNKWRLVTRRVIKVDWL